jgi:hypothetical protein
MMALLERGAWRRIFAGVLVYALVLQGFLFAGGVAPPALAADGAALAGFALCTHDGAGRAAPVAPAQDPACTHCMFCIVGAVYLTDAPPSALQSRKIVITDVAWPLAAPRLSAFHVNESAWPRGPPTVA